jgi:hypothetical protein
VREAYPGWPADRNAIVVYLSAVGVLGIAGWLWTIRAVTKGKNWSRAATTGMFVLGTGIALLNLTFSGGRIRAGRADPLRGHRSASLPGRTGRRRLGLAARVPVRRGRGGQGPGLGHAGTVTAKSRPSVVKTRNPSNNPEPWEAVSSLWKP